MSLSTDSLKEVKMYASKNGVRGSYYIDAEGNCAAKTCSTCRRVLSSDLFGTRRANKYGLRNSCKECENPMSRDATRRRTRSNKNRTEKELADAVAEYYSDGYKVCSRCGNKHTIDMFGINPGITRVLRSWCMMCDLDYAVTRNSMVLSDGTTIGVKSARLRRDRNSLRTYGEVEKDRERLRPEGVKKCRSCGVDKSIDLFYRNICNTDGLRDECMECSAWRRKKNAEAYWKVKKIPIECYICHGKYEELDHVIPLSLDGPDTLDNILPACRDCNRGSGGKFDTPLADWVREAHPETASEVLERVMSYGVDPFPTY